MDYEKVSNEALCGIFCLIALLAIFAALPQEYSDIVLKALGMI